MRSPEVVLVVRAPLALTALVCAAVGAESVGRVAKIRSEVPAALVASFICCI